MENRVIVSVFFSLKELDFLEEKQKKNNWNSRSETIRNLALEGFIANPEETENT